MKQEKIIVELDKSGAEWVCVAYLTGDANMLAVVNGDKSPHVVTGSLITGAPTELVEREDKIVGKLTDPTEIEEARQALPELYSDNIFLPRSASIRQMGKKSNHGLNYDMKYKRFALENEMPEPEANKIVTLYKERAYPGIPVWHNTTQEKLRKDRTLINCFGRKRTFKDAWGPDLFDAAYAFIPQSTIFDITRVGMVKAWQSQNLVFAPADLLAHGHDALIYQYPIANTSLLTTFLHIMCEDYMNPQLTYGGRDFFIDTDIKLGFDWSDANMRSFKLGKDRKTTEEAVRALVMELRCGQEKS